MQYILKDNIADDRFSNRISTPSLVMHYPIFEANDGCRLHNDHSIAPIAKAGEQCQAEACRAVYAPGLDASLYVFGKLPAKQKILGADLAGRAHKPITQLQEV